MPRRQRAKQFAPFDALKGLQDALRVKEFEHERISKGDISEEKVVEISKVLMEIDKNSFVKATYFKNGHYVNVEGNAVLNCAFHKLKVGNVEINFDDLFDLKIT